MYQIDRDHLQKIVEKYDGGLISILVDIQSQYGYLTEQALRKTAELTGYSLIDIYGVATFYKSFSLKPRGKHHISVCKGTACHVRDAPIIVEEFERLLGISPGETTPDKLFSLETVNCLGACALGPIVVIDGHYFSDVNIAKVNIILNKTREGLDKIKIDTDKRIFPVEACCPHCNHSLLNLKHIIDGYPSIRVTVSFGRKHGWLALSSLYGSYNVESKYNIPEDTIINFFCPFCHAEFIGTSDCADCSAPMVPMLIRGGGIVQICSRHKCKSHMLDLGN